MSSLLLDGPISPELVLIALPDEAQEARESLPETQDFYEWISQLRELTEPEPTDATVESNFRGTVVFTLLVAVNSIVALALIATRVLA